MYGDSLTPSLYIDSTSDNVCTFMHLTYSISNDDVGSGYCISRAAVIQLICVDDWCELGHRVERQRGVTLRCANRCLVFEKQ